MTIRVTWRRLALLVAAGALAGLLFAWSGLFNVGASTGHWAPTSWLLHYTMRQSVKTHSAGIEAPPLDDPALARRGAGHFATGCAPCHGAPGQDQSPIVQKMTPPPPRLEAKVGEWEDPHLFWILKHGVKFSAMPAWPAAGRDDEVWSAVAFLRKLPNLTPEDYRRLAYGEAAGAVAGVDGRGVPAAAAGGTRLAGLADPIRNELTNCARCHGFDGAGRGPAGAFPPLTRFDAVYIRATLEAYADGNRRSGIMQPQAAGLDDREITALAEHYARARAPSPPPAGVAGADPALLALGAEIALRGVPATRVPNCVSCHGPGAPVRNPHYPTLEGQDAGYLALQLRLWQSGVRGGTAYQHLMASFAGRMTDEQIDAVALYYASLTTPDVAAR